MTRAIGLRANQANSQRRVSTMWTLLHYEVENRLLRLIDKLEHKRGR